MADTKWRRLVLYGEKKYIINKRVELLYMEKKEKGRKRMKREKIIIKRAYRKSFLQLNIIFNGLRIFWGHENVLIKVGYAICNNNNNRICSLKRNICQLGIKTIKKSFGFLFLLFGTPKSILI